MNKLIEINESEIMMISGGMSNGENTNQQQNRVQQQKGCWDKTCEVSYDAYTKTCDVTEAIIESRAVRNGVAIIGLFALGAQARHQIRHWDD